MQVRCYKAVNSYCVEMQVVVLRCLHMSTDYAVVRHSRENEDQMYPDPSQDESCKAVKTVGCDLKMF